MAGGLAPEELAEGARTGAARSCPGCRGARRGMGGERLSCRG
jgi:hypothetical protein